MKKSVKYLLIIGFFLITSVSCNLKTNLNSQTEGSSSAIQQNQLQNKWIGKYEGSFLRLETESEDPRGWANIVLTINDDSSSFYLFSYEEELFFKAKIIEQNEKSLKLLLYNTNTNKNLQLIKTNNKFVLESDIINALTDKKQIIELTQISKE